VQLQQRALSRVLSCLPLQDGVSGHINHCAVANALANAAERGRLLQETGRPARLFQLQSTGVSPLRHLPLLVMPGSSLT